MRKTSAHGWRTDRARWIVGDDDRERPVADGPLVVHQIGDVDHGTYFRLKVDVTYNGEPQHFDIVVGCNVLDIGYKDGSSTHEVGLVPTVYGRRMGDGKGLVVRPPDACNAPVDGEYHIRTTSRLS